MAFVAITAAVTKDIREHISKARDAELGTTTLPTELNELYKLQEVRDRIDALHWGDLIDLRERLGEYLATMYLVFTAKHQDIEVKARMDVKCIAAVLYSTKGELKTLDVEGIPQLETWVALTAARRDVVQRWAAVQETVAQYLGKCKSLNEAVKVWPDLRGLLPHDLIVRMETKAAKTQKTPLQASNLLEHIDTTTVVGSMMLARMAGGLPQGGPR